MTQEAHLLPGSLQEDPSSKIRLPPISFLPQVPTDFSSMKSKVFSVGHPTVQANEALSAPNSKLLQKQNLNSPEFKSGTQIPNVVHLNGDQVSQITSTHLESGQQFQGQIQGEGFHPGQNPSHRYHSHPASQQFQAPSQYGFQAQQKASQQAPPPPEPLNREQPEAAHAPSHRTPSSTHHHHHHRSHEQEHRHHHHHHHHNHTPHSHHSQSHNAQNQQNTHNPHPHSHNKYHQTRPSKSVVPPTVNTGSEVEHAPGAVKANVESKRPRIQSSGAMVSKRIKKLMSTLDLKRKHLGTLVYNPTTTWDNLQVSQLRGLDNEESLRLQHLQENSRTRTQEPGIQQVYVPVLPPLSETQINNLVEVKIPYKFIKEFQLHFQRDGYFDPIPVWGGHGGVFSDDSDILGALKLSGLFTDMLDLKDWNGSWNSSQVIKPSIVHKDKDGFDLLDLSVTLLLLPGLNNYHGMYQNGVYSRSWVGQSTHDGLSYAIYNVKWESFGQFGREFSKTVKKMHQEEEEMSHQLQSQRNGWVFKHSESVKKPSKTT